MTPTCKDCGTEVSKKGTTRCLDCHKKWLSKNNTGEDNPAYNSVEVECPTCGEEFKKIKSKVEASKRNFCSRNCKYKHPSQDPTNHPDSGFDKGHTPVHKGGSIDDFFDNPDEFRKKLREQNTKHGFSVKDDSDRKQKLKHFFYSTWASLKHRCSNPNAQHYDNYGGRGIDYCDRWEDFENFKNDMWEDYLSHIQEKGLSKTSIDRINNDGNYKPGNCRWATPKEQAKNRERNVI